jgi:serine/threonine-protein kinase SRPK3
MLYIQVNSNNRAKRRDMLKFPPDLHPNNFLLVIADKSVLSDFENTEMSSPSPRKIDGNRVIYRSKELRSARSNGPPTLIDFGKARIGEPVHYNNIQPFIYRAPEVLLEMPWDKKVDIWNLGVMVSYL